MFRAFVCSLCCLGAVVSDGAENAARIHYQTQTMDKQGKPLTAAREFEFSVWRGGAQSQINSGEMIFSERVTLQPDAEGFAHHWLGAGKLLSGALPPQQIGLEKTLSVQLAQEEDGKQDVYRFGLAPIDQAYVIQDMRRLFVRNGREYHPSFREFAPELVRRGVATLYPDGRIQKEDGSYLDTAGSQTSGVQELFDYCASGHVDGYIVGGSVPRAQQVVYPIKAPLHLHPAQGFTLETGSILLHFGPEIGAENGLTIDSCMMVNIFIRGLLVYSGTGHAVAVQPTNTLPLDTFVGPTIVDTEVEITSLAGGGILFDGSINFSRFSVNEINGGNPGVRVTADSQFSNNRFTCKHVHGQKEIGMSIEAGARNVWEVNYNPDGVEPTPVVTAASDDLWFAAIGSNSKPGLVLKPSASGNQFHLMALGGGFVNEATRPTNRFYASPNIPAANLKLGFAVDEPPVAASGAAVMNRNPFLVKVVILEAGSVSGWTVTDVYGTALTVPAPLAAGQTFDLMPGESLTFEYAGPAPAWKWRAVQ